MVSDEKCVPNCRYLREEKRVGRIGPNLFKKVVFSCDRADHGVRNVRYLGLVHIGPDGLGCVPADSKSNIGVRACGPERSCYVAPEEEELETEW